MENKIKIPEEIINGFIDGDFHFLGNTSKALFFDNGKAHIISAKPVTTEDDGEIETSEAAFFKLEFLGLPLFFRNTNFGQFWKWVCSNESDSLLLGRIYAESMCYAPMSKLMNFEPAEKIEKRGNWDMEKLELYWIVTNINKLFANAGFHGLGSVLDTNNFPFDVEFMTLSELSPYEITVNHGKKVMYLKDAIEAILIEVSYNFKNLYSE